MTPEVRVLDWGEIDVQQLLEIIAQCIRHRSGRDEQGRAERERQTPAHARAAAVVILKHTPAQRNAR
jgi:hypothetical protein